jgi:hypothetical protein
MPRYGKPVTNYHELNSKSLFCGNSFSAGGFRRLVHILFSSFLFSVGMVLKNHSAE